MRIFGIAAALALPVAIAACSREPEPPPAPVMSPAEEACSALAMQAAGADRGRRDRHAGRGDQDRGDGLRRERSNGVDYSCTVEIDNTISAFGPA